MKTILKGKLSLTPFLFLLFFTASLQGFSQIQVSVNAAIAPPPWAPAYDNVNRVHYYYLPDLEVYYDVWNHEFVYLDDGNWLFSPVLPAMYGNYDLYGGHVVVLDYNVHQPWMHHELYVAHYPRYYHHTVYLGERGEHSTAFDENTKRHFYGPRVNGGGSIGIHPNGAPEHVEPARSEPNRVSQPAVRRQVVNYHDKQIGQPVRVTKNMQRPEGGKR